MSTVSASWGRMKDQQEWNEFNPPGKEELRVNSESQGSCWHRHTHSDCEEEARLWHGTQMVCMSAGSLPCSPVSFSASGSDLAHRSGPLAASSTRPAQLWPIQNGSKWVPDYNGPQIPSLRIWKDKNYSLFKHLDCDQKTMGWVSDHVFCQVNGSQ